MRLVLSLSLAAVLLLPLQAFAVEVPEASQASPPVTVAGSPEDPARSGCCSHHGGVCGCSGVRAQCCDGSLSPSCGCDLHDDEGETL